ncbi:MAG: DMT family transporter [Pelosinus sp.]|nr:DMT family transporter [Pelosinus sp.]
MQHFIGMLFLTGAFTLAGTSVIAGRFVAGTVGTFTIASASLFFALLALLPLCAQKVHLTIRQMTVSDWLRLLLQALFGVFLFRWFLLKGLLYTSTGEAGILTGATPAVTATLACLFLKEPLYKQRFCGILCTVSGILIIQGIFSGNIAFSVHHLVGNLLVLSAAACESLFNIFSRSSIIKSLITQNREIDPIVQTSLVTCLALLLCLGPALTEHPATALLLLNIVGWGALVWYGVFVTALAFIFWYSGIKRCDASVAAAFSGMMPFTGLLLSVLIFKEQPSWHEWLGGLLIVLGMLLTGLKKTTTQVQIQRTKNAL